MKNWRDLKTMPEKQSPQIDLSSILDVDLIKAERCRRSFRHFVYHFWPYVVTDKLIESWLIDCICDHLQAVYEGKIQYLIGNMPPGFAKSVLLSIMFPAWVWANDPTDSFICCTANNNNLTRDCIRFFNLTNCSEFQRLFGNLYQPKPGEKRKLSEDMKKLMNIHDGLRVAMTTSSGVTGARGKFILNDDPNDVSYVYHKKFMEKSNKFSFDTLSNRNFENLGSAYVMFQQRISGNDASSIAIELGWDHLMIPMEADGRSKMVLPEWKDPREVGEYINPTLFRKKNKENQVKMKGAIGYRCQYQQEVLENEGGVIKREWFEYFDQLPVAFDDGCTFCDPSLTGEESADYMAMSKVCRRGDNFYVMDAWHDKLHPLQAIKRYEASAKNWGQTRNAIEKNTNGPVIYAANRDNVPGMYLWPDDSLKRGKYESVPIPNMGKEARLGLIAHLFREGRVFFPRGTYWAKDMMNQMVDIPHAINDDLADCLINCLIILTSNATRKLSAGFAYMPTHSSFDEADVFGDI